MHSGDRVQPTAENSYGSPLPCPSHGRRTMPPTTVTADPPLKPFANADHACAKSPATAGQGKGDEMKLARTGGADLLAALAGAGVTATPAVAETGSNPKVSRYTAGTLVDKGASAGRP